MFRILSAIAVCIALACAFALYTVSYETRSIDSDVAAQERRIERLKSDIAVLRAELAYISRPERIEPLARAMGFVPAEGGQYVELEPLVQKPSAAGPAAHEGDGKAKTNVRPGQRPSSR